MIINALCYGGDRWFVYVLFFIFVLLIPLRNVIKYKWISIGLITILSVVYFLDFLPSLFAVDKIFYFMVFFVAGYSWGNYYSEIKKWALKYWYIVLFVAFLTNIVFVSTFFNLTFVYRFLLPFTGTFAVMTLAFLLERTVQRNRVVQYVEYCGKYSLQFYLFGFCYPIIRTVIVSVMHITSPVVILVSVFVLQLIAITIIVEITRRIKWLKIPCGY